MEHFVLTKDALLAARTYLPVAVKEDFVRQNAVRCFDRLSIDLDGEKLPEMFKENTFLKSRYLMTALVKLYLGLDGVFGEDGDEWLMTRIDYDRFAGSHIVSQIERFKSDKDTRNICFDLLSDYYDLDKRMTAEIRGLLAVHNDTLTRSQTMTHNDLETLPALIAELQKLEQAAQERERQERKSDAEE